MTVVSLTSLATALAVVAVGWLVQRQLVPRSLAGIPRLDGTWPLLGDFVPLFAHYRQTQTFHEYFAKLMRAGAGGDRGVYQFFWFGRMRRPIVVLADLDETVDIVSKRHAEFDRGPRAIEVFGIQAPFGLLSIPAQDMWRTHRRIIAHTMTAKHVKTLAPSIIAATRSLMNLWEAKLAAGVAGTDGIMEIEDDLTRLTMDIISEIVFGTSYYRLDEALYMLALDPDAPKTASPFADAALQADRAKMFVDALPAESPFPRMSYLLYWLSSPKYRAAARSFRKALKDKIAERRARVQLGESEPTVLDGMLEKEWQEVQAGGAPMPDDEIHDELVTILAAGEETTSSAMCWMLHYLAQAPNAQARLHEEVRSIVPPHAERELVYEDILGRPTPYLDAVVHETLRLAHVVTTTYRTALVDTTVLGVPIPKNTLIIALTGLMAVTGRGLEHAPDDIEQFRPERWLTPGGEFDSKAIPMLPFLAGPRDCVGKRLAMTELAFFTAMLSQSFFLEPLPADLVAIGAVGKELITHRPAKGVRVKLVKREVGV